jgi:hypothetical protein
MLYHFTDSIGSVSERLHAARLDPTTGKNQVSRRIRSLRTVLRLFDIGCPSTAPPAPPINDFGMLINGVIVARDDRRG